MKIGVCARVKNEQKILIDWVKHYIKLGFDKIFIYDNLSKPSTYDQLYANNLISEKIIIKIDNVIRSNQPSIYFNCIEENRELDWLLLIDADEFLDIRINKTIKEFLSSFDINVSSIFINWVCYGTSGNNKYNKNKHLFEQFTRREQYNFWWNRFVKSFIRPSLINKENLHIHKSFNVNYKCKNVYNENIEILNATDKQGPCFICDSNLSSNTPLVLVHYMTLDFESMKEKRLRNIGTHPLGNILKPETDKYTIEWYKKFFKDNVYDKSMLKYIKNTS